MRRSTYPERATRHLPAALLTGALLAVLCAGPAAAQWIGAPANTDATSTDSGATPAAPAPAPTTPTAAPATAPVATPAPMSGPSSSIMVSPGFGGGDGFGAAPAMPGAMPGLGGPGMAPGGAAPAGPSAADMNECQTQVTKLRGDLESRNEVLRKAASKKMPASELCPLFRNFVTSQQKFYNYLVANKSKCGVPDEAIKGLKENGGSVVSIRDKVCQAAAMQEKGGPAGPPPQGAVSQGLGLSSGLPSTATAKGGVFDTLGGDALR